MKHALSLKRYQSLLNQYAATQSISKAKALHCHVITGGRISGHILSTLSVTYALCGHIAYARKLFEEMPQSSLLSYNIVIRMYVRDGLYHDAVDVFVRMVGEGVKCVPDGYTYPFVAKAAGELKSLKLGLVIHGRILRSWFVILSLRRIVHFDIKPQNVLLDDNFCPKVSDFGLAKLCEKKDNILSLLDTRGTIGYIAPEMISRVYGNVWYKSDVYIAIECWFLRGLVQRTKKKLIEPLFLTKVQCTFLSGYIGILNSRRDFENGINNEEDELAKKMTLVGFWCIQPSPLDRPPMNIVVEMMEGSLDALEVPPRPVFQISTVAFQESSTFSEDTSVYTQE